MPSGADSKASVALGRAVSSARGAPLCALFCAVIASGLLACGAPRDNAAAVDTAAAAARSRDTAPSSPLPVVRLPLSVDTAGSLVLDIWPLRVAPGRQVDETRRIVEHMQADLTFMPGFESAALLASGDGTGLVLLAAWRDGETAARADSALAGWLHTERDSIVRRRRIGTATTRVHVRRLVGARPTLSSAAMLQFTRYALKPGHSFGALAALVDSNLAMRVLEDTSAQGGATLAAADSGAIYVLVQARRATALDPDLHPPGPLPFWAPFAEREEQLLAVVALVSHR